jgi:thioredoxin-like negative regulator of GroEL
MLAVAEQVRTIAETLAQAVLVAVEMVVAQCLLAKLILEVAAVQVAQAELLTLAQQVDQEWLFFLYQHLHILEQLQEVRLLLQVAVILY